MEIGALGGGISGSGPSIFALSTDKDIADKIGIEMKQIYTGFDIGCEIYVSRINQHGPRII